MTLNRKLGGWAGMGAKKEKIILEEVEKEVLKLIFSQGWEELRRNFGLVVIPILLDFFSLLAAFVFFGQRMAAIPLDKLNVKFALPSVPPSISDVADIDFMRLNLGAGMEGWGIIDKIINSGWQFFLFMVISFLVSTFVTGGFLGLLKDGISGIKATVQGFFAHGRYFWKRFILLQLLVILAFILSLVFLLPLLVVIRLLAVLLIPLAFLVVGTLLVFVEYALVAEDLEVLSAINRSISTVRGNFGVVFFHILGVMAINLVASFIVNFIGRFSLLPAILLYAPAGTFGVLVLYCLYLDLNPRGEVLPAGEAS